jgi:hypothetical protein
MKKSILLLLLFVSVLASAQKSINDYQFAIVPVKFSWMSKENQYRVSTITKLKLSEMGFKTYYDKEVLPEEVASNRCDKIYIDIEKAGSFLSTKLIIVFRDCQNGIILKSSPGTSKEKNFEAAYREALTEAFKSITVLNYKYSGQPVIMEEERPVISENQVKENIVKQDTGVSETISSTSGKLSLEATVTGYISVDEGKSTIALRLFKTTNPDIYIAASQARQGVLLKKDDKWYFEFYYSGQLISEWVDISL